LLNRHLERIRLAVMRRQRTVGLSFSKHFPLSGIEVPSKTMYRSNTFIARELDKLYSELALLPV